MINNDHIIHYLRSVAANYQSHKFLKNAILHSYIENVSRLGNLLDKRKAETCPKFVDILDWGCGKGHITYILQQNGYKVTSSDIESGMPDSAFNQETPILDENSTIVVPLRHEYLLPFDSESFDVVTSFGVLEHVPDPYNSMREIMRVLKHGGIFYFCMLPTKWSWTQNLAHLRGDYYHNKLYSIEMINNLASDVGFKEIYANYEHIFPKNRMSYNKLIDLFDKLLCETPIRIFATNWHGYFVK